jgi:hypothetical protein
MRSHEMGLAEYPAQSDENPLTSAGPKWFPASGGHFVVAGVMTYSKAQHPNACVVSIDFQRWGICRNPFSTV